MSNNICEFYKKFYEIKKLNSKTATPQIIFLLYDEKDYYIENEELIKPNEYTNILDIIGIMGKKYKIKITNFYPLCFYDEILVVVFKISGNSALLKKVTDRNMDFKYQKIIAYHKRKYATRYISTSVKKEIEMSQKYIRRYRFHEKFIKKFIVTEKKRKKDEFKKLMEKIIPNYKTLIDISCGDNIDALEVAKSKKYETIVGNDICINYLNNKRVEGIIYTNEDIKHNNIKRHAFDVSFCKNTLHHMNDMISIKKVLKFLDKITSKEIIIIEVSDPKRQGGMSKFLNKWLYMKFLKDAGDFFLNETEFEKIINQIYGKYSIEFKKFNNILGNYMIAIIRKE